MSTLAALARAQAYMAGTGVRLTTVCHLHVHDRPLVLIPLAMAGEANAPLAAMAGTSPGDARLLVVAQPRNRDERFAFAADLGAIVAAYVDSFTGVAEPIAVDRGREVRFRFVDAPQIWVPNAGGVDFLRLFGRSTRFRTVGGGAGGWAVLGRQGRARAGLDPGEQRRQTRVLGGTLPGRPVLAERAYRVQQQARAGHLGRVGEERQPPAEQRHRRVNRVVAVDRTKSG